MLMSIMLFQPLSLRAKQTHFWNIKNHNIPRGTLKPVLDVDFFPLSRFTATLFIFLNWKELAFNFYF